MPKTVSVHNGSAANRENNRRNPRTTGQMPHIQQDLVHHNETWIDIPVREAYKQIFQTAVDDYNRRQSRPERKIRDYYNQIRKSAKKHTAYELIIQIGDKNDTGLSADNEIACLREYYNNWQQRNPNLFPLAVRYLRIYMVSMISIVSYNLLSGVLRALGDSRTPLLYQFFGGIINVFADFIFLAVFHMGVEGTALATLFSQTVAAIGIMLHLYRLKEPYALRFSIKECSLREFTDILKVGVPAGVQSIIITLSNIIIQSQINTLGVTAVASFTVYFRVELIVYLPIIALGQAVVSFVGQNYGAGNWNRIKKGNKFSILGGSFATFIACILLIIAMPVILKAFTKDTAVAAQTLEIIKVTFPFYFFYTVLECFSSNLRGFGKAFLPMVVTVVSFCGFRIAALFVLMAQNPSPDKVALSYPISWGIAAIAMAVLYVRNRSGEKTL